MCSPEVLSRLPLYVPQEVLESYPKFGNLLKDLADKYLTKDGTSKELQSQYNEILLKMETEKKEYMKKKILYDELRTILLEYQCNTLANDEMIKIQSSPQVYEVLQEFLVVQEASQYLAPFTASPVSLLALTDKDLHSSAEVEKQQLQVLQKYIMPEVTERLIKRCEQALQFYESSQPSTTSTATLRDRSLQLHNTIAKDKSLKEKQKELDELEMINRQRAFYEYYKLTGKKLEVLAKIIEEHKLSHKFQHDQVAVKWLQARFNTMRLKLMVIKYQMLCETYTPEVVHALTKIRDHLNAAVQETSSELDRVNKLLSEYESMGTGFEKLAAEYATLLRVIEEKAWTLHQLEDDFKKLKEQNKQQDDYF